MKLEASVKSVAGENVLRSPCFLLSPGPAAKDDVRSILESIRILGFHSMVDFNYIKARHFPYCKAGEIVQIPFLTDFHTIPFKLIPNELQGTTSLK